MDASYVYVRTWALGWLKCCFTSSETVGLLETGAQDVHLDFHTAPGRYVTSTVILVPKPL